MIRFKIFGVKIEISFLLICLLNLILVSYGGRVLFFCVFSALFHEFCHVACLLFFGVKPLSLKFQINGIVLKDNANINDIKKTTCKKLDNSNLISTISAYEYVRALANDSYLNNNSYYWTSTNSTDSAYYVFDKGGITTSNERDILGIRPVITLKGNTIVSGDGSKEKFTYL